MKIRNRSGELEDVRFDEITRRIRNQCYGLSSDIDPVSIARDVVGRITDGITTSELDKVAGRLCHDLSIYNLDYDILAARLIIDNHQKECETSFRSVCQRLYNSYSRDQHTPVISRDLWDLSNRFGDELDDMMDPSRDFMFDYFGFKTLEKSYLLGFGGVVVETPQHMWLRVSLAVHGDDLVSVRAMYDYLSMGYFTHATPTLFNAGTPQGQLASCFLIGTDDSIEGIFKTFTNCGHISKWSGGLGLAISNVRSRGSHIRKTGGQSSGIGPMLKVLNDIARYINQGGKRNGSISVYLEPWHADVMDFLEYKRPFGTDEVRARDLFYALWIPDEFMRCVKEDLEWYLMCPDESRGLMDVYGDEFVSLYYSYVERGLYRKRIRAKDIWNELIKTQIETGTPYILFKDAVNRTSNHKNLGVIRSSNLCSEIVEYSSLDVHAVCNLASISLPRFVQTDGPGGPVYDFEKLREVVHHIVRNLNKIIDINYYPTPESRESNLYTRPIGLGVQGLNDVFNIMEYPWDSQEARDLNRLIFENIYYAALDESCRISEMHGPYGAYRGSPVSQDVLHIDYWDNLVLTRDWCSLRERIRKYGIRNSLLTALMPTASTSQILGNTEAFEPKSSNLYLRRTSSGEFYVINKYLIRTLVEKKLWNSKVRIHMMNNQGSISGLESIPQKIRDVYKTVWEIKQKVVIDLASDRCPFVDQSQSMNLFFEHPNYATLTNALFYGWSKGLKTGMYYLRMKPPLVATVVRDEETGGGAASAGEECQSCSS